MGTSIAFADRAPLDGWNKRGQFVPKGAQHDTVWYKGSLELIANSSKRPIVIRLRARPGC
jgi:hypothetical protein